MPGYVNGIPHATSTDRIDLWPTTSRNLAQWVDDNVPRNDDPRLSDARPPTTHTHDIGDVGGIAVDTSVGTRVYIGGHLVHADTGWRDMRGLLAFPAETALFRRVNGAVFWVFKGVDSGTASNAALISGFTGIGPSTAGTARVQRDDLGIRIGFSGTLFIYTTSVLKDTALATSFSYPVRDGWLTTLPGDPA